MITVLTFLLCHQLSDILAFQKERKKDRLHYVAPRYLVLCSKCGEGSLIYYLKILIIAISLILDLIITTLIINNKQQQ